MKRRNAPRKVKKKKPVIKIMLSMRSDVSGVAASGVGNAFTNAAHT